MLHSEHIRITMDQYTDDWNDRQIIDFVFEKMDRLGTAKKFDEIERWLKSVRIEKVSLTVLIGYLTAAHWIYLEKDEQNVPFLHDFVQNCGVEVKKREPERWKSLLQGFRVE